MQAKGAVCGPPDRLDGGSVVGVSGLHLGDTGLPGIDCGLRGIERPVAFVGFFALAEPHHREYAGEVRGEMLEHVGDPFGLVSAQFGTRDFGDEERLVDLGECVVRFFEYLREGLPVGPALALAPVVTVDGDVVDVFVAGIVASERRSFSCIRGVRRPHPLYVGDIFFAEDVHDMAECLGDVRVGVAGAVLAHAPVVPVTVRFVERPEPDFFAVVLDALRVVADVAVGHAVDQVLGTVPVRHPGDHQRGTVFLGHVGVFFGCVPVVDVEEREVTDEVEVRTLQVLESLHVFLRGLRVLSRAADPCADLECHCRYGSDTHREE